jgi:tetratricopeptide (TPR) repeat protein
MRQLHLQHHLSGRLLVKAARLLGVAVLALSLAPSAGRAAESDYTNYFNAMVRLYESLEYERALEQLDKARKHSRGADDDVTLALYEGTIRSDLGQADQARAAFKTALLLRPDVNIPVKVSPKVRRQFEDLRKSVKKELEPLLRKQREEEEKKRRAEEERKAEEERQAQEARRLEDQRRQDDARRAEEVRRQELARRAEDDRRRDLEDQRRRDDQRRLDDQRRAEEDRRLEEQRRAGQQTDVPRRTELAPDRPPPLVTAPLVPGKKPFPVAPVVFLGIGAAAGGVATYFGVESNRLVGLARNDTYQDDTVLHLEQAQTNATGANVALITAGAAALASAIAFIVWGVEPVPMQPAPTQ